MKRSIILVVLSGCSAIPVVTAVGAGGPKQASSPEEILKQIENRIKGANTIRVQYRSETWAEGQEDGEKKLSTGTLLIKRGHGLRLTMRIVYQPLNTTEDVMLVGNGPKLTLYRPEDKSTNSSIAVVPNSFAPLLGRTTIWELFVKCIIYAGLPKPNEATLNFDQYDVSEVGAREDKEGKKSLHYSLDKGKYQVVLYHDPNSLLPLKRVLLDSGVRRTVEWYEGFEVNPDLPDELFEFR